MFYLLMDLFFYYIFIERLLQVGNCVGIGDGIMSRNNGFFFDGFYKLIEKDRC